ncbi:MAG: GNAT family N-acetyltransferase [Alphaproteobacteria bacterium]|jgi:ribosomal protein S18 acetylase RimI-like enzyme|nr:GNAT family N-acetyltransferase [Alphaproteobacteria bacterium]
MNIELQLTTEKDRTFFRMAHHTAYRPIIEFMFGWNEKYQDQAADLEFDTRNPHLILYQGEKVGVIGWLDKSDHIWFGPIYILPAFQSQNIGSSLLENFIDRSKSQQLPLRLRTLLQNERAKKLYEQFGFKVTEKTDIHWILEFNPH